MAQTTFASTGLGYPHGLVFDAAGNLFVANSGLNVIRKFAPDGMSTVFADESDGLSTPIDLIFDRGGPLYVSNGYGGPSGTGSVLKFTPDGIVSTFADSGFQTACGLAFDHSGKLYIANSKSNNIEKLSPTGEDLRVFATTSLAPHFLKIVSAAQAQ
jgi:sugar lactone lactonase YvrE